MNYLLSILIIAVLASQTLIWHSLATIRDAIQQTNTIALAACGSDDRPCQDADGSLSSRAFASAKSGAPHPASKNR
jgi:hypothetical protein